METSEQLQAINAGDIDLGLSRPLAGTHHLESICVAQEPMMLAIPRAHPLATKRRPGLDALNGEPFISFSTPAAISHDKLTRLMLTIQSHPGSFKAYPLSQAILSLVSAGIGLAIVPAGTQNACFDNVVFRPMDLQQECVAELHAIWSPNNRNALLAGHLRPRICHRQLRFAEISEASDICIPIG